MAVPQHQDFEPGRIPPAGTTPIAGVSQPTIVQKSKLPPAVRDTLAAATNAATSAKKPNPAQDPLGSAYITPPKVTTSESGAIPLPMPGIAYYAALVMLDDIQAWSASQQAFGELSAAQLKMVQTEGMAAAQSDHDSIMDDANQALLGGILTGVSAVGSLGCLGYGLYKANSEANEAQKLTNENIALKQDMFSQPTVITEPGGAPDSLGGASVVQEEENKISLLISRDNPEESPEITKATEQHDKTAQKLKIPAENESQVAFSKKIQMMKEQDTKIAPLLRDEETIQTRLTNSRDKLQKLEETQIPEDATNATQQKAELKQEKITTQAKIDEDERTLQEKKEAIKTTRKEQLQARKDFDKEIQKTVDEKDEKIKKLNESIKQRTDKMTQFSQIITSLGQAGTQFATYGYKSKQSMDTLAKDQANVQQNIANILQSEDEKGYSNAVENAEKEIQSLTSLMEQAAQSVQRQV
jgi:hypothetical protein